MRLASLVALTAGYVFTTTSAFAGGCLHFLPYILGGGSGGGNSGGVPAPDAGPVLGMLVTAGIVVVARRRRAARASS